MTEHRDQLSLDDIAYTADINIFLKSLPPSCCACLARASRMTIMSRTRPTVAANQMKRSSRMRAVSYVRVSREEQVEGWSLGVQRDLCAELADRRS